MPGAAIRGRHPLSLSSIKAQVLRAAQLVVVLWEKAANLIMAAIEPLSRSSQLAVRFSNGPVLFIPTGDDDENLCSVLAARVPRSPFAGLSLSFSSGRSVSTLLRLRSCGRRGSCSDLA